MNIEQVFGLVLKEVRNQKNISQSELANLAELDRTYISLLERGLRQPTIETVFKLAEALNLKASTIIQKIEMYNEN
jgi:transcriptional regulator with XRE-family HTH domain